jgi:GntR family transcriptional regulator / MocR family aminotransferase
VASFELLVPVDRALTIPLRDQLYRQLRDAILEGRLPAGGRLPSTRVVAQQTGLARQTVVEAFEQLLAEGYVESRPASGTYVAETLPDELLEVERRTTPTPLGGGTSRGLSARGAQLTSFVLDMNPHFSKPRPFETGTPALDQFPFEIWARLTSRHLQRGRVDLLSYAEPAGYRPLREALAEHVSTVRAARCTADQVIITSGTQQAAYLAAHVLVDPGEAVWIEDPAYSGARGTLLAAGARLVPVPVDAEGLDVAAGSAACPDARLAYVTPSRQFPLGRVMSLQRRRALLEWARRADAWVLEDDYDSEYRYASRPLASLQGLDTSGCVVYMGTLSKMLFPALRLGYLIAPPALVEPFARARALIDRHGPTVEQAVLADFIVEGHLARHVRRMRALYAERHAALVGLLQRKLRGLLEVEPAEAGMHVVAWLPEGIDDVAVAQRALDAGVITNALSPRYMGTRPRRGGLLLGFSAWPEHELVEPVDRLAAVLRAAASHAA